MVNATIKTFNPTDLTNISAKAQTALIAFVQKICKLNPESKIKPTVEQFTSEFQSKLPSEKALKAFSTGKSAELWLSQPRIFELQTPDEIKDLINKMHDYIDDSEDFDLRVFKNFGSTEVKKQFTEKQKEEINQIAQKEITEEDGFDCFSDPVEVTKQTMQTEDSLRKEIDLLNDYDPLFNAFNYLLGLDRNNYAKESLYEHIDAAERDLLSHSNDEKAPPKDFFTTLELADARVMLEASGIANALDENSFQTVFDWMDENFKLAAGENTQALAEYRNKALACFPQEVAGRLRAGIN
jgi:hypothetical protein